MLTLNGVPTDPADPAVIKVLNTDVVDFDYNNGNTRDYGLEVIYRNA